MGLGGGSQSNTFYGNMNSSKTNNRQQASSGSNLGTKATTLTTQ